MQPCKPPGCPIGKRPACLLQGRAFLLWPVLPTSTSTVDVLKLTPRHPMDAGLTWMCQSVAPTRQSVYYCHALVLDNGRIQPYHAEPDCVNTLTVHTLRHTVHVSTRDGGRSNAPAAAAAKQTDSTAI